MRIFPLTVLLLISAALAQPADRLIEFEIEDQFQADHSHAELADRVAILVWSDRESSELAPVWTDSLRARLDAGLPAGSFELRPVAHTKGAPFFVKGRIRGRFSKEPAQWALLDWGGRFQKAYDPPEKQVTVFVFDREGRLVARETGLEFDPEVADRVVAAARGFE